VIIERRCRLRVAMVSPVFNIIYNLQLQNSEIMGHLGHQDFSEDTYRTLSAADNSVMLVGVAHYMRAGVGAKYCCNMLQWTWHSGI
jgi:peptide subunit release factor RF-3